jgi:hypothetical protein
VNPWIVIGAFFLGFFTGLFVGVVLGVTGERLNAAERHGAARGITSTTELERLRARRAHPTSKPHPWN